jgi:hypothetical protein
VYSELAALLDSGMMHSLQQQGTTSVGTPACTGHPKIPEERQKGSNAASDGSVEVSEPKAIDLAPVESANHYKSL